MNNILRLLRPQLTLLSNRLFHKSPIYLNPISLKMPALSPTMTEGNIVQWLKKEGEEIQAGDLVCEIQTDKAVVGMECDEDGVLAKIIKPENSQGVKVGDLIAVIAVDDEDWKSVEIPEEASAAPTPKPSDSSEKSDESTLSKTKAPAPSASDSRVQQPLNHHSLELVGPATRLLMEQYGISVNDVKPTGPHDNLMKGDILNHINSKNLKPLKPSSSPAQSPSSVPKPSKDGKSTSVPSGSAYEDIPLSSMRKTIAKRLSQSKSGIPHSYSSISCNLDELLSNRQSLKARGINVSVNDYIIKAVALALKAVPEANSTYVSEEEIKFNGTVDVSVAVATDSGLITPIVNNADSLGLVAINKKVKQLAEKARDGKLQPQEFMGGTFTISNLGMFGIKEFTAIINPPQVGILAVGTLQNSLSVQDPRQRFSHMTVTLSSDARVVDDITAARFLNQIKANMERPSMLEVGLSQGAEGLEFLDDPFENSLGL